MQVTKFNLITDLQIMLSNVTQSKFYFECNTERGSIDQLYIELGLKLIANCRKGCVVCMKKFAVFLGAGVLSCDFTFNTLITQFLCT